MSLSADRAMPVIMATVFLDAVGIGLIMPILPSLLRDLAHSDDIALHVGTLAALYAAMQFLCAPALGALSDRFGRRPVLLASLAGAAVDYAVMAMAPTLGVLYLGRAIAGLTGANMPVATAFIADITPPAQRARRYGLVSACFSLGFIAGPAIGGLLAAWSLRAPFWIAGAVNGLNLLVALLILPETRAGARKALTLVALAPLSSLRWVFAAPALLALIWVDVVSQFAGQAPPALWALHGGDRYGWSTSEIGLSLAAFGALDALFQAFAVGWLTRRIGEGRTVLLSLAVDACGFGLLAAAHDGWMALLLLAPLSFAGVGAPALQALMASRVDSDRQGALQGALAAINSLAAMVGPIAFTALYSAAAAFWLGAVWAVGAALFLLLAPMAPSLWRAKSIGRAGDTDETTPPG